MKISRLTFASRLPLDSRLTLISRLTLASRLIRLAGLADQPANFRALTHSSYGKRFNRTVALFYTFINITV